jgi:hypothetical protein
MPSLDTPALIDAVVGRMQADVPASVREEARLARGER